MSVEARLDSEAIEATIRQLMFRHASIAPRGWMTISQRQVLHREIDRQYDLWFAARLSEYAADSVAS